MIAEAVNDADDSVEEAEVEAEVAKELVCVPMAAVADAHPNTNVQTDALEVRAGGLDRGSVTFLKSPPSPLPCACPNPTCTRTLICSCSRSRTLTLSVHPARARS